MSLQEVTRTYQVFDKEGKEIYPSLPELVYATAIATQWNKLTVSASANDESLAIGDIGTIKLLELRVKPADKSKITVKYSGVSEAYSVSPIEVTSENITSITASNSTTLVVDLYWRAIYS